MPSLFHSPARVISEAAVFPCWFLLDQLCYQFCKLPLFTPPIKSRPEASCLQRNHIGSAIVLMRAISEFFSASRRVEFVTFSAVNKRKKKKTLVGTPSSSAARRGRREQQMLFGAGSFKTPLDQRRLGPRSFVSFLLCTMYVFLFTCVSLSAPRL